MARLTHIVVILSLIVATTMQPALAYAGQSDCSAGCTSGFACQGCGCCEVKTPTAKCSCCRENDSAEDDAHGGCCGHASQRRLAHIEPVGQKGISASADICIEEQLDSERTYESERSGVENQHAIKASEPSLSHACTCFTNPKPLDAPTPRSPINDELRDLSSGDIAGCVALPIQQQRQGATQSGSPIPTVAAHFVQITFCVWRL